MIASEEVLTKSKQCLIGFWSKIRKRKKEEGPGSQRVGCWVIEGRGWGCWWPQRNVPQGQRH